MHRLQCMSIVLGFAVLPLTPSIAQDTPHDLRDLVGARAGQAEGEFGRRGYTWVRTQTGDDRKWSFWSNRETRACVAVATADGRYASITSSPAPDCDHEKAAAGVRRPSSSAPPPIPSPPREYRPLPDAPAGDPLDGGDRLSLICWGEGQKPGVSQRSSYVWNDRLHRYEPHNSIDQSVDGFESTIQLELWRDGGRIRLAGKLIAPLNSGDHDGWWDLYDVQTGRDRIIAHYRMNGLNKPRVDVDRRTGRIAIDGIEHFRGTCSEAGPNGDHNRF